MERQLSHVDVEGRPRMVDVAGKAVTLRHARAKASVVFPAEVAARLRESALRVGKGSVVDTAIIAATMAVKRTSDLIPFCHPLPILGCRVDIAWCDDTRLGIECEVRTEHRTGVEMEALTGASVAALTIYDMCKALSHRIIVTDLALCEKLGGTHDVHEAES